MKSLSWLVCVGSLSWLGCAQVQPGEPAAPPTPSNSLAAPLSIVAGEASASHVDFVIAGGFDGARPVTLTIGQPTLRMHTTASGAELDALDLPLGDVDVPASALPPSGLALRQLALSAAPTRAEILDAGDDALTLRATTPLTLRWSLELADGTLYPLGAVATAPLALAVQIARSDGPTAATVTVTARCAGTCWAIDGLATLSDGAVYLAAAADVTAE